MIQGTEFIPYVTDIGTLINIKNLKKQESISIQNSTTNQVIREYLRAKEDDLTPPDSQSFKIALQFIQRMNDYKSFISSVCALGEGGFSFRFQKNESEYIDIDIYNGDETLVFLHSQFPKKAEAYDLTISDTVNKLKDILTPQHLLEFAADESPRTNSGI